MQLPDVLNTAKAEIGSLIEFRQRGKTIEVMTGVSTLNQSMVSVFVSQQGDDFVVSDGGWLHDEMYHLDVVRDEVFDWLADYRNIKRITDKHDTIYYYRIDSNVEMVSAMIHDVAYFVQSVINHRVIASLNEPA